MKIKNFPPKADQPRAEKLNNGFTLLETLAAIAVFSFGILGPMALVSYSIHSASAAKDQTLVFYLAGEAMEYIRDVRDSNSLAGNNWLLGLNQCQTSNGCVIDVNDINPSQRIQPFSGGNCNSGSLIRYNSATGQYNLAATGPSNQLTTFCRYATVKEDPLGTGRNYEALVTVTVTWSERSYTKTFVTQEYIYDWK